MNKYPTADTILNIKSCESGFIKFIHDRLGITIHHHQIADLSKIISGACHKFNCTPQDYLLMLKDSTDHSPFLEHLVGGITVGETYFFRDKKQMQLLKETVLPNIIKLKREQENLTLRIWSAGCATGEEIYTIAMLINEIIPDMNKWTLNFMGTDINVQALKKAIAGQYAQWSMRSVDHYFLEKYFTKNNSTYILSSNICNMVNFLYLNLNDDSYPSIFNGTNSQDLIICRNVLIYFSPEYISNLMTKLSNSLIPGGYLLLGASDPIQIQNTNLIFHHKQGLLFSRPTNQEQLSLTVAKPSTPMKIAKPIDHLLKKLITTSANISEKKTNNLDNDKELIKLLDESRWQEVLDKIQEKNINEQSAFILNAKAISLANLGKLEQAAKLFEESLVFDATNKYTYFVYALTLTELNHLDTAEKMLRKTLFLDRQFVVSHFQLGLLLLRKKQNKNGIKCIENALTISLTKNPEQFVPGTQGLNYGRFAEILRNELTLYETGNESHANEKLENQKV